MDGAVKKSSSYRNKTWTATALIITICLLSSCSDLKKADSGNITTSSSSAFQDDAASPGTCPQTDTASEGQTSAAHPVQTSVPDTHHAGDFERFDNDLDILFIGNSLTDGIIPSKFLALSEYSGRTAKISQLLGSGRKLSQHLNVLNELSSCKAANSLTLLDKTDIVVLQEHITADIDTVGSVTEIQRLFDADTEFYYLLTEFDIPRIDELKELDNISFIPCGYVHDSLLKNGFSYAQLHALNDFHPNALYGYVSALTVYSVVYNTGCIGMPYDFLDAQTIEIIPGNTVEEKKQTVRKIQELVMEAIEMIQLYFPFTQK